MGIVSIRLLRLTALRRPSRRPSLEKRRMRRNVGVLEKRTGIPYTPAPIARFGLDEPSGVGLFSRVLTEIRIPFFRNAL
jgi:hypothetical protein